MTDDLLRPTVTPPPDTKPPWRIRSQFWVAFLGGPLPATVIAYLNAGRLRLGRTEKTQIVIAGAVALAVLLVPAYFSSELAAAINTQPRTATRLALRAIGLLLYLVLAKIQRPADRLRVLGMDERYDSLWAPGLAAVIGLGIVQALFVVGVMALR